LSGNDPLEELFEAAAAHLAAEHDAVAAGRALSRRGLMVGGKLIGFPARGQLVVKLPRQRVDELVAAGASRFDANKGRPMREWVCLDPPDEDACLGYLREACAFVGGARVAPGDGSAP